MRIYSIVFSPTGGTAKVASIVTEALGESATRMDLTDRTVDFSKCVLDKDALAVIAVPAYSGRVPAIAAARLREINGNGAKAVIIAVYGNRAYEDTLLELRDVAIESGFTVIAGISAVANHSIIHEYGAGRPDTADEALLREFADTILAKLESNDEYHTLTVPGNWPYQEPNCTPLAPYVTKDCNRCGACARVCPVGAIALHNADTMNSSECIYCMRCVTVCPQHARKVTQDKYDFLKNKIAAQATPRKTNELFI